MAAPSSGRTIDYAIHVGDTVVVLKDGCMFQGKVADIAFNPGTGRTAFALGSKNPEGVGYEWFKGEDVYKPVRGR